MPSTEHGRSQRAMASILEEILPEDDIVAVELMLLLDRHNWTRHLTPDIFVALGVGPLDPVYGVLRRQYRLWDEGRVPDLVYEAASPSTFVRDSAGKKDDYAALGVREYVQFDPVGGSSIQGCRSSASINGVCMSRCPRRPMGRFTASPCRATTG